MYGGDIFILIPFGRWLPAISEGPIANRTRRSGCKLSKYGAIADYYACRGKLHRTNGWVLSTKARIKESYTQHRNIEKVVYGLLMKKGGLD